MNDSYNLSYDCSVLLNDCLVPQLDLQTHHSSKKVSEKGHRGSRSAHYQG